MCGEFNLLVDRVDSRYQSHASEVHSELMERERRLEMKTAESGFVVPYICKDTKRILATFAQRESGIKLRVFADHVAESQKSLNAFPRRTKTGIRKVSICKQLLDPNDYDLGCRMGYTSVIEREQYQKCRYTALLPTLNGESHPYILRLLHKGLDRVDGES